MSECIEYGCTEQAGNTGYCITHQAQFWPLWAAHPVDEPCPPGCPSKLAEISDYYQSGWGREATAEEIGRWVA